MIINAQRTIYGIDMQLAMLCGVPYTIIPNTTLNEKFKIAMDVKLGENEYPMLKYYAIGVGGNSVISGTDTYSFSEHTVVDAALFTHTPFVMRPTTSDLSITDQLKYRFKTVEVINGVEYYCYYLKCIENIDIRPHIYSIRSNNNSSSLSIYDTNTDVLLNPVPRVKNIVNGEYVAKVAKLEFTLFEAEMNNISEAISIKFGSNKKLTEIGVCSGVDKLIDGVNEATSVQVTHHVHVDIDTLNSAEIIRSIEIGGMEYFAV